MHVTSLSMRNTAWYCRNTPTSSCQFDVLDMHVQEAHNVTYVLFVLGYALISALAAILKIEPNA